MADFGRKATLNRRVESFAKCKGENGHERKGFFQQCLAYDAEKDFEPIGYVAELPIVLSVHPSMPGTTASRGSNWRSCSRPAGISGTPHWLAIIPAMVQPVLSIWRTPSKTLPCSPR